MDVIQSKRSRKYSCSPSNAVETSFLENSIVKSTRLYPNWDKKLVNDQSHLESNYDNYYNLEKVTPKVATLTNFYRQNMLKPLRPYNTANKVFVFRPKYIPIEISPKVSPQKNKAKTNKFTVPIELNQYHLDKIQNKTGNRPKTKNTDCQHNYNSYNNEKTYTNNHGTTKDQNRYASSDKKDQLNVIFENVNKKTDHLEENNITINSNTVNQDKDNKSESNSSVNMNYNAYSLLNKEHVHSTPLNHKKPSQCWTDSKSRNNQEMEVENSNLKDSDINERESNFSQTFYWSHAKQHVHNSPRSKSTNKNHFDKSPNNINTTTTNIKYRNYSPTNFKLSFNKTKTNFNKYHEKDNINNNYKYKFMNATNNSNFNCISNYNKTNNNKKKESFNLSNSNNVEQNQHQQLQNHHHQYQHQQLNNSNMLSYLEGTSISIAIGSNVTPKHNKNKLNLNTNIQSNKSKNFNNDYSRNVSNNNSVLGDGYLQAVLNVKTVKEKDTKDNSQYIIRNKNNNKKVDKHQSRELDMQKLLPQIDTELDSHDVEPVDITTYNDNENENNFCYNGHVDSKIDQLNEQHKEIVNEPLTKLKVKSNCKTSNDLDDMNTYTQKSNYQSSENCQNKNDEQ